MTSQGMVYAWCVDGGLVKVGFTANPRNRFRSFDRSGETVSLYLSELTDNPREAERMCHEALQAFRCHGEWFRVPYQTAVETIAKVVHGKGEMICGWDNLHKRLGIGQTLPQDVDPTEWFLEKLISLIKGAN